MSFARVYVALSVMSTSYIICCLAVQPVIVLSRFLAVALPPEAHAARAFDIYPDD